MTPNQLIIFQLEIKFYHNFYEEMVTSIGVGGMLGNIGNHMKSRMLSTAIALTNMDTLYMKTADFYRILNVSRFSNNDKCENIIIAFPTLQVYSPSTKDHVIFGLQLVTLNFRNIQKSSKKLPCPSQEKNTKISAYPYR